MNVTQDGHLPRIALVGRVNVGKSTLFNRLIEKQKAIVSDIPGTTRTSNEGVVLWRGREFTLIDTGGLTFEDDVPLEADILKHSERAMKQADIILFVVDAKSGIMPSEKELAKRMRRIITKPVILVVNKVDNQKYELALPTLGFEKLGLGEPWPVSAASGRGAGDLLDHLFATFDRAGKEVPLITTKEAPIRVTIIGKPNVGKSSLFNKVIGQDKVIVSDMPHTTREPHDTLVSYTHHDTVSPILFVDTAGIRRKGKVSGELERLGIHKSIEAIGASDIVLFVLDASEPASHQDKQLGGLLERQGKSVIIIFNKWDLALNRSDRQRHDTEALVQYEFPHLNFAPLVFVSGKTGYGVHDIFPLILHAWAARHTNLPTSVVHHCLQTITKAHAPSRGKGTRQPKLLGLRQTATNPPVFELLIKQKTSLHRSYVNFIERKLREQFDFFATPIIIRLSKMKR